MNIILEKNKDQSIVSRKNTINNKDELILKLLQILDPNVKKVTYETMKDFLKKIGIYIPSKLKSEDLKNKLLKIIEHTPEEGWDLEKLKEYVIQNEELDKKMILNFIQKITPDLNIKDSKRENLLKFLEYIFKEIFENFNKNISTKKIYDIFNNFIKNKDKPQLGWSKTTLLLYLNKNKDDYSFLESKKKTLDWKETENKAWNHYQEGQEYYCPVYKIKFKVLKKEKSNKNKKADIFLTCLDIKTNKQIKILIQVKQDNFGFVDNWIYIEKLYNYIENSKNSIEEKEEAKKEILDLITFLKTNDNEKEKFILKTIKFQTDNRNRTAPNIITNCRYLTGIGMCFSREGSDEYKIKSQLLKKIVTEGMDEGIDYKKITILGKDEEYNPEKHDIDMKEHYKNIDIYFNPRPIYSISGRTQNNMSLWIDYEFCQSINIECHKKKHTILPLEFLNFLEDAIKNVKENFEYNGHKYILQREEINTKTKKKKKYNNLNCYYPVE